MAGKKLTWDATGLHLYETGVDRGVLYPQVAGAYPLGVAWNGITAFTESPAGADAQDKYADNIKYLTLRAAETFGATLEAYTYPDEFMECDGSAELVPGAKIGQQKRKPFGLSYRTMLGNDTDNESYGYLIHLVYGCTASPSEKAYASVNDSPDTVAFSWSISTTPVTVTVAGKDYKPTATLVINSTKATPAGLKALEDALYGSDTSDARLPLPEEVMTLLNKAA
jgi:hypothetical protein